MAKSCILLNSRLLMLERQTDPRIEGLNLSSFEVSMTPAMEVKEVRY